MTDSEKKNYLAKLLAEDLNGYLLRGVFIFTLMLFLQPYCMQGTGR
jgi:hypothetical protein